jgi:predicted metal-dependent peptidase
MDKNRHLNREELLEISASLEDYHEVFYHFWSMSSISFIDSPKMPTACVSFADVKPRIMLNYDFWYDLTKKEQLFVICHECFHVILDHENRNGKTVYPDASFQEINIAQDIPINELIRHFGFNRDDIREWEKYCWIDTVFKGLEHLIKRNETFLYYLGELLKYKPKTLPDTVDQHGDQEGGEECSGQTCNQKSDKKTDTEKENARAVAEELLEKFSSEDLQKLKDVVGKEAGIISGMLDHQLKKVTKSSKVNFYHIIRKLKKTAIKQKETVRESFVNEDRRFNDIINSHGVILPGSFDVKKPFKDKLSIAVFMDVSGSCISYLDTFNKVIQAFEKEKKLFDTRMFIFDTVIKEVSPGDKIRVGGGTSFSIIEDQCLKLEAESRYPDCVVVITDGFGDRVSPKASTKWVWLLTSNSSTEYVPSQSRSILIKNVTFENV